MSIRIEPPKAVAYADQIQCVQVDKIEFLGKQDKLCRAMTCPKDKNEIPIRCNKCIGNHRLADIKKAVPELNGRTILEAIQIWEVLLK